MRLFLIIVCLLPSSTLAKFAIEQPLADPQAEQSARALFDEVLCQVCEGQAISSSESEFAQSMRAYIREQFRAGKSEPEIRAAITQRYGEGIWLKPQLSANTILLWSLPFLLPLALASLLIFRHNKRGRGCT